MSDALTDNHGQNAYADPYMTHEINTRMRDSLEEKFFLALVKMEEMQNCKVAEVTEVAQEMRRVCMSVINGHIPTGKRNVN